MPQEQWNKKGKDISKLLIPVKTFFLSPKNKPLCWSNKIKAHKSRRLSYSFPSSPKDKQAASPGNDEAKAFIISRVQIKGQKMFEKAGRKRPLAFVSPKKMEKRIMKILHKRCQLQWSQETQLLWQMVCQSIVRDSIFVKEARRPASDGRPAVNALSAMI